MKVLITGSRGFVGKHFTRYFANNGWDVHGIDIRIGTDCRDFFKRSTDKHDLVVHLAAIVGGRLKIEGDPLAVATDLSIDAEMFNWAVRTKQRRVVYFSSSAAYPIAYQELDKDIRLYEAMIDPNNPAMPDFTYGWAKLTGEQLARYARDTYGIPVHVLRPFSGYGPGQDGDYPFPAFVQRALRGDDPFLVWGDGAAKRDFIHITDIVRATMAIVDAGCVDPMNLCTGRGTSFNELAKLFGATNIVYDSAKPVGVSNRVGDPSALHMYYTPTITLEQGIEEALNG